MNRRLALLLAAAAAALGTGVVLGARGGDDEPTPRATATAEATAAPPPAARAAVRRLSPARLAGATVIMRFAGAPEPAYVREALRAGRAAGVILFRDNVPTPAKARSLTGRLQRAARAQRPHLHRPGGRRRSAISPGPRRRRPRPRSPREAAAARRPVPPPAASTPSGSTSTWPRSPTSAVPAP